MRWEIQPLGPWTDPVTENRAPASRFRSAWPDTLDLLSAEVGYLDAQLVVFQIAVLSGDLRRDGMLRSNARVGFPGVRISFGSKHGPLTYATDAYDDWQANVRAIALGLGALRAVDRYGITRTGQQYTGWQALTAKPEAMTRDQAAAFIARWASEADASWAGRSDEILNDPAIRTKAYRAAAIVLHPDRGGSTDQTAQLNEARRILDAPDPRSNHG